jgi:hypothetical protein
MLSNLVCIWDSIAIWLYTAETSDMHSIVMNINEHPCIENQVKLELREKAMEGKTCIFNTCGSIPVLCKQGLDSIHN